MGIGISIGDFPKIGYSSGVVDALSTNPKFKDGHMFESSWPAEDQQAVKKIAEKIGVDLHASDVAGEQASFASIEAAASKIGKAVTRHVMEDLAIQQTQLLDEAQPCPTCQKRCDVEVRPRTLKTAEGPIELPETVCHCSACRRDFFPSTHPFETSPARL
jgi:predicted glycoside hydrolase/deacetylase ChbG (UPF0249 family)